MVFLLLLPFDILILYIRLLSLLSYHFLLLLLLLSIVLCNSDVLHILLLLLSLLLLLLLMSNSRFDINVRILFLLYYSCQLCYHYNGRNQFVMPLLYYTGIVTAVFVLLLLLLMVCIYIVIIFITIIVIKTISILPCSNLPLMKSFLTSLSLPTMSQL